MPTPRGQASFQRSDWRKPATADDSRRAARWMKRVVLSLLLLGLVAWLVWLLIPPRFPAAYLVYVPVLEYDTPIVPAPLCTENIEDLSQLRDDCRIEVSLLDNLQTSESIGSLARRLQGLISRPRSVLILYVNAQGVSDAGTPYLLCSDFLRGTGQSANSASTVPAGRYELANLYQQVHQSKAHTKLLVLDVDYLASDSRLGMIVNEFPRLAEAEVKKIDDPGLWVLLGNRALEQSRAAYKARRSAFGYFFFEALRGDADRQGDNDGNVDLAELLSYVRRGVDTWVLQQTGHRLTQTPMLLRGGVGTVLQAPALQLVQLLPRRPPAPADKPPDETSDKPPGKTPDKRAASAPIAAGSASAAAAAPARAGQPPLSPTADSPPGAVRDRIARLLRNAWRQRDQWARRGTRGFTAVDYAPHLWRELQDYLLGNEGRFRYGIPFSPEKLAALEDLAGGDAATVGGSSALGAARAADRTSVLGGMLEAGTRFDAGPVADSFQHGGRDARLLANALRLRDDLFFAAPCYVRWHGQAALLSPDTLPLYSPIADLLGQELPRLEELLERVEQLAAGGEPASAEARSALATLAEHVPKVEALRTRIDNAADGLRRMPRDLAASIDQHPWEFLYVDSLLWTPLVEADSRMQVVDALTRLERPLQRPSPQDNRQRSSDFTPQQAWQRFAEQARLELLLARLADPAFSSGGATAEAVDAMTRRDLAPPQGSQAEERLWERYRGLGHALGEFYGGLPARIARAARAADLPEQQRGGRLLRLIDGRDVRRLVRLLEGGPDAVRLALRPLPSISSGAAAIRVTATPAFVTIPSDRDWVEIGVAIEAGGPPLREVQFTLQYDRQQIEIIRGEDQRPLAANQELAVAVDPDVPGVVHLKVRAQPSARWLETTLVLRAAAGALAGTGTVRMQMGPPDVVDLVAERVVDRNGPTASDVIPGMVSGRDAGRLLAAAFPNRVTEFVLKLANLSGRAKQVNVELWAQAPTRQPAAGPRLGPLDNWGQPLPGFRRLAQAAGVKLAAGARPVPIAWAPPTEPKKEGAAGPKVPPPSKPEAAAAGNEPIQALVCMIYDVTRKDVEKPPRIKWLDFWPIRPRTYVDAAASFQDNRIAVRLNLRAGGLVPAVSPERPVLVKWDTAALPDAELPKKTSAELAAADQEGLLFAEVPRGFSGTVPVSLEVDGYPRAVLFNVRCDRPRERVEPERSTVRVHITAPPNGQAFFAPLRQPIGVQFRVDAPEDSFLRPDDNVELWTEVFGQRDLVRRFPTERQVDVRLLEVTPQGLLQIDTEVHDFDVPVNPGELGNTTLLIRAMLNLSDATLLRTTGGGDARLRSSGAEGPQSSDSVRVMLDAAPPEFVRFEAPREAVPQGSPATVQIEARDPGSGVAKIELGLDLDNSGVFQGKGKLAELLAPNTSGLQTITVPTTGVNVGPIIDMQPGRVYTLVARATDGVGHFADRRTTLLVGPPPAPPPTRAPAEAAQAMPPGPTTVSGRLVLGSGGEGLNWVAPKVWIESPNREAQVGSDGQFLFQDLPPGTYKLQAKGIAGNQYRAGSASVTVNGQPATVTIHME